MVSIIDIQHLYVFSLSTNHLCVVAPDKGPIYGLNRTKLRI